MAEMPPPMMKIFLTPSALEPWSLLPYFHRRSIDEQGSYVAFSQHGWDVQPSNLPECDRIPIE